MKTDTNAYPGFIFVTDATEELRLTLGVKVSPEQARIIAAGLDSEGKHDAAAQLRKSAHEVESADAEGSGTSS